MFFSEAPGPVCEEEDHPSQPDEGGPSKDEEIAAPETADAAGRGPDVDGLAVFVCLAVLAATSGLSEGRRKPTPAIGRSAEAP